MQAQEGSTIGHYRIQRLLKRGGMSQVYLAYDTQEEREVAIKIADGKQSERAEDYQRLQREVVMLNTVQGTHILPVLAYGQERHLYYLVMPYMRRGTLLDRLA
jgi:serine/threonine-protein kinase